MEAPRGLPADGSGRRIAGVARAARWPAAIALVTVVTVLAVSGGDDDPELPVAEGPVAGAPAGDSVAEVVGTLSPGRKADQLILAGFEGSDPEAQGLGALRNLGGAFVGQDNWPDRDTGTALVGALREATRGPLPPIVATSQEGGELRLLSGVPPTREAYEVGADADPAEARRWARGSGRALREAGIDLNLGIPADLAAPAGPRADRGFAEGPELAAELVAGAIGGCRAVGIVCGVFAFPGMGAASQDTDEGPAAVGLAPEDLLRSDLVPFEAAFRSGSSVVVLSHALYTALDPVTPGSLSRAVATDLLRGSLAFDGVAITDDLMAGAIRAGNDVAEAAVRAIVAGADMVLVEDPGHVPAVRRALREAVDQGAIPGDRLDQAVGRVVALKHEAGLLG